MKHIATLSPARPSVTRKSAGRTPSRLLPVCLVPALLGLALLPSPARAVDGCLVLLCFAAPSWRAIPQCVPPIRQVLRDLARGRAFPTCGMAGPGNSASHHWASAPSFCPPQYTQGFSDENGSHYTCEFSGAVSVNVNGQPFSRTWWNMGGDSVTDFSPGAKAQLGQWDTRFDQDYARWQASLPPFLFTSTP